MSFICLIFFYHSWLTQNILLGLCAYCWSLEQVGRGPLEALGENLIPNWEITILEFSPRNLQGFQKEVDFQNLQITNIENLKKKKIQNLKWYIYTTLPRSAPTSNDEAWAQKREQSLPQSSSSSSEAELKEKGENVEASLTAVWGNVIPSLYQLPNQLKHLSSFSSSKRNTLPV